MTAACLFTDQIASYGDPGRSTPSPCVKRTHAPTVVHISRAQGRGRCTRVPPHRPDGLAGGPQKSMESMRQKCCNMSRVRVQGCAASSPARWLRWGTPAAGPCAPASPFRCALGTAARAAAARQKCSPLPTCRWPPCMLPAPKRSLAPCVNFAIVRHLHHVRPSQHMESNDTPFLQASPR